MLKKQRKEIKDQMISHEYFENSLDPFEEKYHCKFSEKKHSLKGLYNESIYTKIDIEDYKVYLENMWEEIKQRISEEVFPNLKYQLNFLNQRQMMSNLQPLGSTLESLFQLRNHSLMNKLTKS